MFELTGIIKDITIDFLTKKPNLLLSINEQNELAKCFDELGQCDKVSIKIDKYHEKRSLNANNYAWKLITELGAKRGTPKEEIYRGYIKDVGLCRQVEIDEKAADTLMYSWGLNGLGWFSEKLDYGEHEGFVLIDLYYGSSCYNKAQMNRLISNIVQDCDALGIQTKTPEQIAELLSLWEIERKKNNG